MICNNCGSQLGNTAKFCGSCGCPTSPDTLGNWSTSGDGRTSPTSPVSALFSESAQFQTHEPQSTLPPQQPVHHQYEQMNPSFNSPPLIYQYQIPVHTVYVKRKEPGLALLLSLLIPGLGQIYNGDVGKGIAFMIAFFVLIWIGVGIVFWIWAMIDAHQVATNINFGRRI